MLPGQGVEEVYLGGPQVVAARGDAPCFIVGSAKLGKDGLLMGTIRIKNGDDSSFSAKRCEAPDQPISDPPSYRRRTRQTQSRSRAAFTTTFWAAQLCCAVL
jgi:hypothetical protein